MMTVMVAVATQKTMMSTMAEDEADALLARRHRSHILPLSVAYVCGAEFLERDCLDRHYRSHQASHRRSATAGGVVHN